MFGLNTMFQIIIDLVHTMFWTVFEYQYVQYFGQCVFDIDFDVFDRVYGVIIVFDRL